MKIKTKPTLTIVIRFLKKIKIIIILFILFTACKSEKNACSYLRKGEVCIKIINRLPNTTVHTVLIYERNQRSAFPPILWQAGVRW